MQFTSASLPHVFCNTGAPAPHKTLMIMEPDQENRKSLQPIILRPTPFHPNVPAWSFLYINKSIYTLCLFNLSVIFMYGSQFFVKNLPYFFLSLYFCATLSMFIKMECLFLVCEWIVQSFIWMVYQIIKKVFLFKTILAIIIVGIPFILFYTF